MLFVGFPSRCTLTLREGSRAARGWEISVSLTGAGALSLFRSMGFSPLRDSASRSSRKGQSKSRGTVLVCKVSMSTAQIVFYAPLSHSRVSSLRPSLLPTTTVVFRAGCSTQRCLSCHSGDEAKGKLDLMTRLEASLLSRAVNLVRRHCPLECPDKSTSVATHRTR